jgi:ketosteroid isomerase-like protein
MSSNAERVREAFARWNAGDRTAPVDEIDPDVEVRTPISDAFKGEPFRGHDGVREWLATLDENFDRWELMPNEFHERGNTVVVLGRVRLRGRGSGVELEQDVGWLISFRGGKFSELQSFPDHEEALAAGGIS